MTDIIPLLHCDGCNNDYSPTTDYFHRNDARCNGLDKYCKQCRKEINHLKYARAKNKPPKDAPSYLVCKKCEQPKPATTEYFGAMPTGRYGLKTSCKECINAIDRQRKEDSEWHEGRKAQKRMYHRTHKDEEFAWYQRWYAVNREVVLEKDRQFRIDHPEILAARWQRWAKTEHGYEHCRTRVRNRRTRKKAIPGAHTAQEIREQYDRQKGKCYYCQHKVKWGEHWVDHTFPISREFARNSIDHLVITCETCNERKGNKYPHEFFEGGRLL